MSGSDPIAGDRLGRGGNAFQLDFTEDVTLTRGGMRLLNRDGEAQPLGKPRVSGSDFAVPIPGLAQGAYVLVWRVVSADSHPVQGAVPFHPQARPREVLKMSTDPTKARPTT